MKTNNVIKVRNYIARKIESLQAMENESAVRATLAHLRRGVGKPPGALPELWEIFFDGFPEELEGRGGIASRAETAIHISLCLFASHQQGKDICTDCVHQKDIGFGQAVARMVENKDELERVKRRFDAVVTAGSVNEFAKHAQGLIKQLRAKGITLDYGQLAADIYRYGNAASRDSVRLNWGRNFYYQLHQNFNKKTEEEDNE
ncbi:MAG: type I-E CRISPR-associated protein Cse2/CasB [Eubacteriales bacterium]|nr:type I-E CRISPR-associated protein Cse2/CasB [Eubacteriales bacterium]